MSIELPSGMADYNDQSPPPKSRQLLLIAGFIVGLAIALLLSLDWTVSFLAGLVPPSVEQQLGALIVPSFEQQSLPSLAQDDLNQMLGQLTPHLPETQRDRQYKVFYIPDETVNAFAIPGDRIIIYQGLVAQAESENELMMVLGHELGHFKNRDHLRRMGRGLLLQLLLTGMFGDVGGLQAIALNTIQNLSNSSFSQSQELQADEVGLSLLQKAYGQVAGATDLFERLSQKEGLQIDFLATHPNSDRRVQHLEELIQQRGYAVGERSPLPASLQK